MHGGANTEVMKMLLDIKEIDKVEPWIKEKMSAGERIMGMGQIPMEPDVGADAAVADAQMQKDTKKAEI